jgi:hypothetical protein
MLHTYIHTYIHTYWRWEFTFEPDITIVVSFRFIFTFSERWRDSLVQVYSYHFPQGNNVYSRVGTLARQTRLCDVTSPWSVRCRVSSNGREGIKWSWRGLVVTAVERENYWGPLIDAISGLVQAWLCVCVCVCARARARTCLHRITAPSLGATFLYVLMRDKQLEL